MSDHSYKQKAKELKEHYAKFDAPVLAISMIEELLEKQANRKLMPTNHNTKRNGS